MKLSVALLLSALVLAICAPSPMPSKQTALKKQPVGGSPVRSKPPLPSVSLPTPAPTLRVTKPKPPPPLSMHWNRTKPYVRYHVLDRFPRAGALSKLKTMYYSTFGQTPCALIASEWDTNATDYNLYAIRMIEVLQQYQYRIFLILDVKSSIRSIRSVRKIAAQRGINITTAGVSVVHTEAWDTDAISNYCDKPQVLFSIGSSPCPTFTNIASHGIYIANIKNIKKQLLPDDEEKQMWLSYDQIWLPTWKLQAEYNTYILPLVDYAHQGATRSLWPVINSVVVGPDSRDNALFVTRARSLFRRGELEGVLRANFHRLKDIDTEYARPKAPARYAAAIYEGRIHYGLGGICQNVMAHLLPKGDWDLHVFHSDANDIFVRTLFDGAKGVTLNKVRNEEQSIHQYNILLTGKPFWEKLAKYDSVLIFQVDTFFLRPLDTAHLRYDYIGAPWCLRSNKPGRKQYRLGTIKAENMISVGNGGLSLRTPVSMLRCIKEFAPQFKLQKEYPEDLFFVQCLTAMKMNIAPPSVAKNFATEQLCSKKDRNNAEMINTTALHAAWYTLKQKSFENLLTRYGM
jgi:hypothetical protein